MGGREQSIFQLLLLLALILYTPFSSASQTVTITQQDQIDLSKNGYWLEDRQHSVTVESFKSFKFNWQPIPKGQRSFGYSTSTWWFKYDLTNHHPKENWILEVAYPVLDKIEVYIAENNKIISKQISGDKYPFEQRPIHYKNFLFPISIPKGSSVTIYLKVNSSGAIEVPVTLWSRDKIIEGTSFESLIHGLFLGAIAIIAIYNLLLFTVLRERAYLYYVSYLVFLELFISSLYGWSFQVAWPTATQWNDRSITFFLAASVLFGCLFSWRFLCLEKPFTNWFKYVYRGHYVILPSLMVLVFILPHNTVLLLLVPYAVYACTMGWVVGIYGWLEGRPSAPYYVMAWGLLFTGGIVLALTKSGHIENNLVSQHSLQIGLLLEVLLFSFALAERINLERTLRLEAQDKILETQKEYNHKLEDMVEERTEQLKQANNKLRHLINTDQLTGVKNRRYLDEYLEKEFFRCKRYQRSLAVVLIDIDHFKQVNDTYGHTIGDHCIQTVASILLTSIRRPTDVLARFGGEEFCLILPETTPKDAHSLAERMRKKIESHEITNGEINLKLTCSFGIFGAIPSDQTNVKTYIEKSDTALYRSKREGRNRVSLFDE